MTALLYRNIVKWVLQKKYERLWTEIIIPKKVGDITPNGSKRDIKVEFLGNKSFERNVSLVTRVQDGS